MRFGEIYNLEAVKNMLLVYLMSLELDGIGVSGFSRNVFIKVANIEKKMFKIYRPRKSNPKKMFKIYPCFNIKSNLVRTLDKQLQEI